MNSKQSVKTILISHLPLPYHITGSWTNMFNRLLESNTNVFDYLICPEPKQRQKRIIYSCAKPSKNNTIKARLLRKGRYRTYEMALKKIIKSDSKYVIHIIDNYGLVITVSDLVSKSYNRNNFFIQYYYHGFLPIKHNETSKKVFESIDEMLFITTESYKSFLKYYNDLTFKVRVIHNGIDLNKFKPVSENEKAVLREKHNVSKSAHVFIWCSHDRPKKGLHIILDAFRQLQNQVGIEIELLVVGVNRDLNRPNVKSIGHIANEDIIKYYQIADTFLFPSLCQEGFGIVLVEALHCGCQIIASDRGGVKEVLEYGKYGVLIDKPNIVSEWVNAMKEDINRQSKEKANNVILPKGLYGIENWEKNLTYSLTEAKSSLE